MWEMAACNPAGTAFMFVCDVVAVLGWGRTILHDPRPSLGPATSGTTECTVRPQRSRSGGRDADHPCLDRDAADGDDVA